MTLKNAAVNLKNKLRQSKLFLGLLAIAMTFASAFVLTKSVLYSQNFLYSHPEWSSYSSFVEFPPAYHVERLIGRVQLAGNRFNPFEQYGNQRVFSTSPANLKSYSLNVRIKKRGYIDFLYNFNGKVFSGVRISRNEYLPGLIYTSSNSGEFSKSLPLHTELDNSRHTLTLQQTAKDELTLFIDDEKSYSFGGSFDAQTRFGFLTSTTNLEIFDISISQTDGSTTHFDFSFNKNESPFFWKNLTLVIALTVLLTLLAWPVTKSRSFGRAALKACQFIFFFSTFWYSFDYFYYSRIAQTFTYTPFQFKSLNGSFAFFDFEKERFALFRKWYEALGGHAVTLAELKANGLRALDLDPQFCDSSTCSFLPSKQAMAFPPKSPSTRRLLFIGGSFSAGAGSETNEQGFFRKIHSKLVDHLKETDQTISLESLNVSESSFQLTPESVAKSNKTIDDFQPDFILLTCYFSGDRKALLDDFFSYAQRKNVRVVAVIPPNSSENIGRITLGWNLNWAEDLDKTEESIYKDNFFHSIKVGASYLHKKYGIKIINPNKVLNQPPSVSGLVWWDVSHPTPYGISVMVDAMEPDLYHQFFQESQASKNL